MTTGFHPGELVVQQRAGALDAAARLEPMVRPGGLTPGAATFVSGATFGALTARDRAGRLWTAPLQGEPGFVTPESSSTLRIRSGIADTDPLFDLPSGQAVGVIVIDYAARRRLRVNGHLDRSAEGELLVSIAQAYGNCPQYIPRAQWRSGLPAPHRRRVHNGDSLRDSDIDQIRRAATFILGTTHPTAGNDASHRGGPPGFVTVSPRRVRWPDYPGNNMFNSLGNLAVDPTAALMFAATSGRVVQISGEATVTWGQPAAEEPDDTGRGVEFRIDRVVVTTAGR